MLCLIKIVVVGVFGFVAVSYVASRVCDVLLWLIVFCVVMWGYVYKRGCLNGVVIVFKVFKFLFKYRRGRGSSFR